MLDWTPFIIFQTYTDKCCLQGVAMVRRRRQMQGVVQYYIYYIILYWAHHSKTIPEWETEVTFPALQTTDSQRHKA